jgi:peptidoglycan-N-acetylglucosamine deacetylase
MRNVILTVDLERDWETDETEAIEKILPKFLELLKKNKAKATFFVVGELAEKFPKQIKQIIKQGHEIASHSHTHKNLKQITFDELEKEVFESKKILEKLGAKVNGFRAPFGIAPIELLDILKKYKYNYDSSIIGSWFPGRYNNIKNSKPHITQNNIIELPIPNFSKFKIPAGLSYNRLFYPTLKNSFAKEPYMIYLHLHEFLNKKQSNKIPIHVRTLSHRNSGDNAWKIFEEFIKESKAKFITCEEYIQLNSNKFSEKLSN